MMGRWQTLCKSHLREEILACGILRIEASWKQDSLESCIPRFSGWTERSCENLNIHNLKGSRSNLGRNLESHVHSHVDIHVMHKYLFWRVWLSLLGQKSGSTTVEWNSHCTNVVTKKGGGPQLYTTSRDNHSSPFQRSSILKHPESGPSLSFLSPLINSTEPSPVPTLHFILNLRH